MSLKYLFLCLLILLKLISAFNLEESDKKFVQCGLYGFRCLDNKRAEFCDEKYQNIECSPKPPRIFECADGLVCDEEKTEFCSPAKNSYLNCTTKNSRRNNRKRNANHKSRDVVFGDIMESVHSSTRDDIDDNEEEPTEKPENDRWNGNPPITCGSHGFYPGLANFFIYHKNDNKIFFFDSRHHQQFAFLLLRP